LRQAPISRRVKAEGGQTLAEKERVLVMDDDATMRKMLNALMTAIGYRASLAAEGPEAVASYREAKNAGQPFAAVLLDLTIPGGIGGREVVKQLLEIDPKVKAIVSSGHADDPIMSQYRECGFSAALLKPYSIESMKKTLSSLLNEKEGR
jgi:two-component system cell cycle sensor histidine kinase/response regulator CckA